MNFEIRSPLVSDANALGELHVQIWRDTYRGMMSDSALDSLDPQGFIRMWTQIAASALSADRETLIAVVDGSPIGFASRGPAREEDPPRDVQLWSINVERVHHGTGVADALLDKVLGDRPAYLWVADGNARAIRFYQRHGFELDGGTQHDDDLGCDELRMVR